MRTLREAILKWLDHPRASAIIVVAGLVLRLALLTWLWDTPFTSDAGSYHEMALELISGRPFEPDWPPGVPGLLAIGYSVFGAKVIVGRLMMLGVYLAFCAAVLALGKRLGGRRVANLALAVFAVTPIFVWTSVSTLTPLPTAALVLGATYFADRCRTGEQIWKSSALLGACLAGLLLTRPSNILMVGVLPVYLVWRKARWQSLVVPALLVAFFTSAWCFKAYEMTGRPVFINNANSQNIFYGNNPYTPLYHTWWYGSHKMPGEMSPEFAELHRRTLGVDIKERDRVYVEIAMDHIRDRPDLFVLRTVNRVRVFMGFDTFTSAQISKTNKIAAAVVLVLDAALYVLVAVLALLFPAVVLSRAKGWTGLAADEGDVSTRRDHRKRCVEILLLLSLLYAVPYYVTFAHPTVHVPVTALVAMIGAFAGVAILETGFVPIWRELHARARRWTVVAVVAFLLIQIEWGVALIQRVV